MAMRQFPNPVSADDLDSMPDDGNRYEVIDGELFVTPAPMLRHQAAVIRLLARVLPFADAIGLAVFSAPTDVRVSPATQVEPDVFVMSRRPARDRSPGWVAISELLLAVEVLSPSTAGTDRKKKRDLYVRERVTEYWIIDADARSVSVWRPGATEAEVALGTLTWRPIRDREPLVIDLERYFVEVHEYP